MWVRQSVFPTFSTGKHKRDNLCPQRRCQGNGEVGYVGQESCMVPLTFYFLLPILFVPGLMLDPGDIERNQN